MSQLGSLSQSKCGARSATARGRLLSWTRTPVAHFLFAERGAIVDRQPGVEGFSQHPGEAQGGEPQWSPNGSRFVVCQESNAVSSLILKNAAGCGSVVLDSTRTERIFGTSWSPDGQWISYVRSTSGILGARGDALVARG